MNNIYVMWWQGIENAPDIVKICYKSLLKNYDSKTQQIIFIDYKNYKEYVDIPNYIIEKYERGIISLTHLSDFIRAILLYKKGGLWIDATILVTKRISDKIFDKEIFIKKNPSALEKDMTSKWQMFLMGGKKGYKLFKLLTEFYLEYWKNEEQLITYLLMENLLYVVYKENKSIRDRLDEAKPFYYQIDHFQKLLNNKYDEKIFNEICLNEDFIKLSYKFEMIYKVNGDLTFYGKLKELYNV